MDEGEWIEGVHYGSWVLYGACIRANRGTLGAYLDIPIPRGTMIHTSIKPGEGGPFLFSLSHTPCCLAHVANNLTGLRSLRSVSLLEIVKRGKTRTISLKSTR